MDMARYRYLWCDKGLECHISDRIPAGAHASFIRVWARLIEWRVLLKLKVPVQLEIRPARHVTTKVILSDGTRLSEPPAIEGYLYRIKPNTTTRAQIYISTHDGNIFTMSSGASYHLECISR